MKLGRNAAAKTAALVASAAALVGTWTLVRQNPPATADTPAATEAPAPTSTTAARQTSPSRAAQRVPLTMPRHTRTRVS